MAIGPAADLTITETLPVSELLQPALSGRRTREAPLSFAQERLWFIYATAPDSPTYNVPLLVTWHATIDQAALRAALRAVVTRHEVLRTTYRLRDGAPVQWVDDPADVPIDVVDASEWDDDRVRTDALRSATAGFDLSAGPVIRCTVWTRKSAKDCMLLNVHHIAIDGWSLATLFDDLAEAYRQALDGAEPRLPDLPVQYADFAVRDREAFELDGTRTLLADRAEMLRAIPGDLVLEQNRTPGRRPVRPGGEYIFDLPKPLLARVDELARTARLTPFVVFLAAYQAVLQRWSGREEFLVGTITANRQASDVENLVGCFVNTVPLRCAPRLEDTFAALCGQVRIEAFRSLTYQRIPFDRLVTAVSGAQAGFAPVGFALQNMPEPQPNGHWGPPELLPTGTAKFDLVLVLENGPAGMRGRIEYDADRYTAELARHLGGNYLTLLTAAVEAPGTTLAGLPLSPRAGGYPAGVLVGAHQDLGDATSVLDLVAQRMSTMDPDACAVSAAGTATTWRELDTWSWALAAWLTDRHIGRGAFVPVLAARGAGLVAGWLGVLRTGAAYAPLSLDTPADRLAHILHELRASVVVADQAGAALLKRHDMPIEVARIEDFALIPGGPPAEPPRPADRDPAVVIYTSGTTGRPKGVLVPHGGMANTTLWWGRDIDLGPADRVLCTWSTSFDGASHEVFRSLIAGSELVFADDDERRDPVALARLLREVTVTSMTPSLLRAILDADEGGPTTLRTLYVGGEGLPVALARECLDRWDVQMRNIYGPTEASCISTYAPVDLSGGKAPAIGVPVPNTRCYVLGAHQEELPAGTPGELYVAGVGVALGYLGQPETAFLADPFAPGARMYRTGDRVVLRPDGLIEYLGRTDDQVKVLGNRIELSEVRRLLEEQPAVRSAAVQVGGDPQRVTAWVELSDVDHMPTRDEVLLPLLRWLPAAVLPAEVYVVDAIPMTGNDKTDVVALDAMRSNPLAHATRSDVDLTPGQQRAAQVFAEALGRDAAEFGPDTNFFTQGGHSLLAVKMLSSVDTEVVLRDFLAEPTVAGLAVLLAVGAERRTATAVTADRFPASPVQQRFWMMDRVTAVRTAYLAPVITEITGPVDVAVLGQAVELVLGRHPALRSRFALDLKQRKLFCTTDGPAPEVTVTDAGTWTAQEVRDHLAGICWTPFDLAVQSPVRGELVRTAGRILLVLAAHHIVTDGWSQQLLSEQIAEAYQARLDGREPRLPEAIHPAALVAVQPPDDQVAEVIARLTDAPTDVDLPHDRARTTMQSTAALVCRTLLDPQLTKALRGIGAELGCTTFMTTAALLAATLARTRGQRDFLFAFPWAGRETAASATAVGMFVNTLVLRADLRGEPTWRHLLEGVREHSTFCYRNANVPFNAVATALHPDRDLSRPALTPVYLNALSAPAEPAQLGFGTRSRYLQPDPLHVKYELEVTATDHPETLELACGYPTGLFDEPTVSGLLTALEAAAADLVAEPDAPVLKEI